MELELAGSGVADGGCVMDDILHEPDDPRVGLPMTGDDPYDRIRLEIDGYYKILRKLVRSDPSEVFQHLSAISARMSEIRTRLIRVESRKATAIRTKEVDPLLEEVDRQFKFHSRLQATREMEASLTRGQT